jgi:hypothetical protein
MPALTEVDRDVIARAAKLRPARKGFAAPAPIADEPPDFGFLGAGSPLSRFPARRGLDAFRAALVPAERERALHATLAKSAPPPDSNREACAGLLRTAGNMYAEAFPNFLLSQLGPAVEGDATELQELGFDLDAAERAYSDPNCNMSFRQFHKETAARLARKGVLESRLPARSAALAKFKAALPGRIAAAIPDVEVLVSTLYEQSVIENADAPPSPRVVALAEEIAEIDRRLDQLSTARGKIQPGPIATGLQARRAQLVAAIDADRAATAAGINDNLRSRVDAALAGDLGSWSSLVAAVRRDSGAFSPSVAGLVAAPVEAMIDADPETFAAALCGATDGANLGREFA